MTDFFDLSSEQDDAVEAYVDKNGCCYDEARRHLGLTGLASQIEAPVLSDAIAGPLSERGEGLDDLLHTGRNSDRRRYDKEVSLASMRGEITEAEREILYSRKKD